jgi:hypothetical protein
MSATLAEALVEVGGPLGELAQSPTATALAESVEPIPQGPAQLAACGPRAAGHEREYELLLEMIVEGSRLHYGSPVVVRPEDPDLALLLGDQLYALGLARLAALGNLDAVSELADVISLVAQSHADAQPELAEAVWEAGATAIGWGSSVAHEQAKSLARAGDPAAAEALRRAARAAANPPPADSLKGIGGADSPTS